MKTSGLSFPWSLVAPGIASMFRRSPLVTVNERIFHRFCPRYLDWRGPAGLGRTFFGARFECDLRDSIQSRIFYFGVWEPHLSRYFLDNLSPGDVFIDIGANIGYFSLLAASTGARVVAFEASPTIFAILRDNIRRNGDPGVAAHNLAVSDRESDLIVYLGEQSNIGKTTTVAGRAPQGSASRTERVRAVTLSAFVDAETARQTRFIKIDVEGAEEAVLSDIARHLDFFGPDMEVAVEISIADFSKGETSFRDILGAFAAQGFRPYLIRNEYLPDDYLRRVPPEPPHPLKALPEKQFDMILSRRLAGEAAGC